MRLRASLFTVIVLIAAGNAKAMCFKEAGERYGINPYLLKAIAYTESSLRPNIESPTKDIGLMGINRSWLPIFSRKFGITESDVWNPCMNVNLGAWVLASNMRVYGNTWTAVGAYSAACSRLKGDKCDQARLTYANKVYKNWLWLQNNSAL